VLSNARAASIRGSLEEPQPATVAIITSQAAQFSAIRELQVTAQRNAVRAAAYGAGMPVCVIAENQIGKLGTSKLAILPSPQALEESTWQALLAYVKSGGNLLVTGPVERDPHWHRTDRTSALGIDAQVEPLTVHSATMSLKDQTIELSFGADPQSWLEDLQFKEGQQVKEISSGNGRIFWAPYPVELAEGTEPAASLYSAVFHEIGLSTPYDLKSPQVKGVLIYPTILQDAVLYVMVSESDRDADIDLIDKTSGAELKLRLSAQHGAMALLRKSDGAVTAKYGF
jgi:hypothetical protein